MANDIQINGNVIGGRQGWAYICNSFKFPVIKVDLDMEQKYGADGYNTYGKVRVIWSHRGSELHTTGTLECEKGEWTIGTWGCCIHASFGYYDMKELIEDANLPLVRKDDVVALAFYSKKSRVASLSLFKIGAVNPNCQTMTHLIRLTDEEMNDIKVDANRWCNR